MSNVILEVSHSLHLVKLIYPVVQMNLAKNNPSSQL